MNVLEWVVFLAGAAGVVSLFLSAVGTVVVPRGVSRRLTQIVFAVVRRLFQVRAQFARDYEARDRAYAMYAPLGLLMLPLVWLAAVLMSYTAIFWALGVGSLRTAFTTSGSSLLTLGFSTVDDLPATIVAFTEATAGLILVALLITYLPSMYAAFTRREARVTTVTIYAGDPPWAIDLIERFHHLDDLDGLNEHLWAPWTTWFVELEETHTSLGALAFFRSPQPHRSWVTAAGVVLDSGALVSSTLDLPRDPNAELCLRSGYLALRAIADFFDLPHDPEPAPDAPISIARDEFDVAYDRLADRGVPLKPDRDQAWRDFSGWRVNYDTVLLGLAALTMAPYAPWSSDRTHASAKPRRRSHRGGPA